MTSYVNSTNQSALLYGCNGEVEGNGHRAESVLMGTVMILMIIVSLFGNSLVIILIYKFERLRNITNTLLCSLAVSDLLSPIFRVTFIAISQLIGRWSFRCSWCAASSQIGIFFCAASIAHLCVITLERYIKIVHPYRHNMWLSKRAAHVTVFIIWMISVGLAVLPFIFKSKIDLTFNQNLLYCEVNLVRNPYLSIIMAMIFFAFPFLVMCIAYYHIFLVAHQQNKKMSVCSIGNKATKNKRLMKQELKAVKTVVIVVGVFFILWSPYFVIAIVQAYHPEQPYWVSRFAICCAYLNTCCNWVVYCILNKQLRSCLLKMLNINLKAKNTNELEVEQRRQISHITQMNTTQNRGFDSSNDIPNHLGNTEDRDMTPAKENVYSTDVNDTELPDWQLQSLERSKKTMCGDDMNTLDYDNGLTVFSESDKEQINDISLR